MAFRGYELNLMLRVQDRASSRLRRLSADLGGMNRAAQIQRDAARLGDRAISKSAIAEQTLARTRLLGLNQASTATEILDNNLKKATAAGKINAAQAAEIARNYERAAAASSLMAKSRVAIHAGSVAAMFGGVGVAISAGTAGSFASFNRETTKAATQMRGVNESFEKTIQVSGALEAGVLDLTRRFPSSATEMAKAAYDIASSMDFSGNSVSRFNATMRVLKVANKVSVAGITDLASATNAMLVVLNNFDPQAKNINKVMNTLFTTVRFGRGDFAQFAELFGPVAAAAKGAGQTLEQAGGALAFLTTRLPRPQASAGLQRLLQIIGDKRFQVGFQDIFKTPITVRVDGVEKLESLSTIITKIIARAPDLTKGGVELQNLIQTVTARGQDIMKGTDGATGVQGTIQARRALVNLVTGWRQYRDVLSNVTGTTNEFDNAFKAASKSPGVRWQVAINQFKAFAIVFGQNVLPAMLRVFDSIGNLIHRFEDLSQTKRKIIGQFVAWGSIILFLSGILSILVGSVGLLIGKLVTLGMFLGGGTAGVVGRMSRLLIVARGLAAIGAIVITLKVIKTGDATGWDLLAAAGTGALVGSRFGGPIGALVGGVTFPMVLQMAVEVKKLTKEDVTPLANSWKAYQKTLFSGGIKMSFEDFQKRFEVSAAKVKDSDIGDKILMRRSLDKLAAKNKSTTTSIYQQWADLTGQLTGLDVFQGLGQSANKAAAVNELNLARALATGNDAVAKKALRAAIATDKAEARRMEKLKQTPERVENLIKVYEHLRQTQDALNTMNNKATSILDKQARAEETLQATKIRALQQAKKDQINDIASAASNLLNKYKELEDANRAAFAIFGGPISTGPIAQVYDQINNMLTGFGAKPIPIPISLQIQDLEMQNKNFARFQEIMGTLRGRGVPQKLLDELQAKGVSALPLLEGLAAGSRGALSEYVKNWNTAQKSITEATKKDMNRTLTLWKSYGQGIAWQIVQGLASDKAQATLLAGYKKWLTGNLGKALKEDLSKQVAKAVADWMATHKSTVATASGKGATTKVKPGRGTGGTTRATQGHTTIRHGDSLVIHADSPNTARGVTRALNRYRFEQQLKK